VIVEKTTKEEEGILFAITTYDGNKGIEPR
jgi:hypothetical protein